MKNYDFNTLAGIMAAFSDLKDCAKAMGLLAHIDFDLYWNELNVRFYKDDGKYNSLASRHFCITAEELDAAMKYAYEWLADYKANRRAVLTKEVSKLSKELEKAQAELATITDNNDLSN